MTYVKTNNSFSTVVGIHYNESLVVVVQLITVSTLRLNITYRSICLLYWIDKMRLKVQ